MCLLQQWRVKEDPLSKRIRLDQGALGDLQWWASLANWQSGGPIWEQTTETCIVTDASRMDWGAHWEDQTVKDTWLSQEPDHINALELRAVILAISEWIHMLKNRRILIRLDNISTVQYINQQGGTVSPRLCQLALELWEIAVRHNIWLVAAHIKGESNVIADALSRGKINIPWSEWSLCPRAVKQVFNIYGTPNIDLFASKHNNKLPTYCSWDLDPKAVAQDSLSIEWTNIWGFAYPPISLIPQILRKVLQSQSKILLIAP